MSSIVLLAGFTNESIFLLKSSLSEWEYELVVVSAGRVWKVLSIRGKLEGLQTRLWFKR